jgi:hypothetical protein|tara:strand:+ start:982 stop:1128 length:147 start_codon:yes stop_codon:yes gene_type:complete
MSKYTDRLLIAVQEIAEIIYMELPIEYRDKWLKGIIEDGIWLPEDAYD